MDLLYRAGIYAYSLSVRAAAIFNPKAKQFISGRKNWRKNLAGKIEINARYIWVHCASLGEFEQGRPLIEAIKQHYPEYKIVLTFFSPSGYEVRKDYEQADIVTYLPLDTPRNARKFLQVVSPVKAFFVKYEYWHAYISELNKRKIPLYIVSAIFRENQQFFRDSYWGRWYKQLLHQVTHFFVQDEKSAKLLQVAGITEVTITGDTRFDRVAQIAQNAREIPEIEKFRGDNFLLVAGSTWKPDEDLLAEFMQHHNNIRLVIAPHEVTPANITRLESQFRGAVRFSRIGNQEVHKFNVLIIDSIGLLSSLYRYGNLAYIGGGFGVGIHNILEAATFGLPVVFGPNYSKFREAVDLIAAGGASSITGYPSLNEVLTRFIINKESANKASAACKNYVAQNTGSTQKIIQKVFNI